MVLVFIGHVIFSQPQPPLSPPFHPHSRWAIYSLGASWAFSFQPMLTFFLAGLLYLLCFEHVNNLGAYSIPSETGLLIPSDYTSYRSQRLKRGSDWRQ